MTTYLSFEDLPDFLREYIKNLVGGDATHFVKRPTQALNGRTILELANAEGVKPVAEYLSNVGTKFGLSEGVKVPAKFEY